MKSPRPGRERGFKIGNLQYIVNPGLPSVRTFSFKRYPLIMAKTTAVTLLIKNLVCPTHRDTSKVAFEWGDRVAFFERSWVRSYFSHAPSSIAFNHFSILKVCIFMQILFHIFKEKLTLLLTNIWEPFLLHYTYEMKQTWAKLRRKKAETVVYWTETTDSRPSFI